MTMKTRNSLNFEFNRQSLTYNRTFAIIMYENYNNETELLSLMTNKDEFLRYITQQYKDNCCTVVEPVIWALHFNVPKYQRLPLLEKILLQKITYIRINYSFLPEKQILGKAYELLGIPTVCGEPDKCFLNTYKKYKSYYPIRYHKGMKATLDNEHISINRSISGPNYSPRPNTSFQVKQEITSSTPITEKVSSLMINPLLSPINIPMNEEYSILWTDSFLKKNHDLNKQNITLNSDKSKHIGLSKTLETLSINNVSNQKLQNIDIAKLEDSNNTQNQMYFISRDPKYVQVENDSLQSSNEKNISYIRNEEYFKNETECNDNNMTSQYFNNIKKVRNKKQKCMKQNLSKKLKKKLKKCSQHLKIQKSIIRQPISIKKSKLLKIKLNPKKLFLESGANESWIRMKQAFSNDSFSDLDITAQAPITMKSSLWLNKHCNSIEQNSTKLNYNHWDNSNTFSENSSLEISNIVQTFNADESEKYNVPSISSMNSQILSEDSFSLLNLTNSSQQFNLIKREYMKASIDSCDDSNYENDENQNKVPKLFNNIQFIETSYSILDDIIDSEN